MLDIEKSKPAGTNMEDVTQRFAESTMAVWWLWTDWTSSDVNIEQLFLHICETHSRLVAQLNGSIGDRAILVLEDAIQDVVDYKKKYVDRILNFDKVPLCQGVLVDKELLKQAEVFSPYIKENTIRFGQPTMPICQEILKKLGCVKAVEPSSIRITETQQTFADETSQLWWLWDSSAFNVEHIFLYICETHSELVTHLNGGIGDTAMLEDAIQNVVDYKNTYVEDILNIDKVPLYRRCSVCGEDTETHSAQHMDETVESPDTEDENHWYSVYQDVL